eukprot:681194-Prymnesium_polylepis.1
MFAKVVAFIAVTLQLVGGQEVDCSRIVPMGSSCNSNTICEGCCTHVGRCRNPTASTGGLDSCDNDAFNQYPYPRCHWIGEH